MDREQGPIDLRSYALLDIDRIWGTAMRGQQFPDGITWDQRFRIAAAALAMPTAEGVVEFYKNKGEHEFKWMTERLVRVCELTCLVWEKAEAISNGLGNEFTKSYPREVGAYGRHQLSCTANKYFEEVSATQTPAGWATPRLLIALEEKHGIRVGEGNPVDDVIANSLNRFKGPVELLDEIAEYMHVAECFDASELLGFLLKSQTLVDQSNLGMYYEVVDAMPGSCPNLWKEAERLYSLNMANLTSMFLVG